MSDATSAVAPTAPAPNMATPMAESVKNSTATEGAKKRSTRKPTIIRLTKTVMPSAEAARAASAAGMPRSVNIGTRCAKTPFNTKDIEKKTNISTQKTRVRTASAPLRPTPR